ncbi:unnamed protein product [Allacma fusca]|uniref:Uncharacterized protein n=1 Tax=Allacma fusca TaxID=39272 RepID=A0A8J2K5N7_9HEXA|nr:unnamed protein product [Allacma fusca]
MPSSALVVSSESLMLLIFFSYKELSRRPIQGNCKGCRLTPEELVTMSWRACWALLVFFVQLIVGQEEGADSLGEKDGRAYQGTERCVTVNGTGVVGLRPDTATEDCTKFHFCRVTGPPSSDLDQFPVQAVSFNCPSPNAPYYDAKSCECVEGSGHCAENNRYINSCVRPYVLGEPEETCQSIRDPNSFYENLIPRFNRPREFWSCAHSDHPEYKTVAHRLHCSDDLTFDLRTCDCRYTKDQVEPGISNNPMRRYQCASILHGRVANKYEDKM